MAGVTHLPVYLSYGACVLGLRLTQQALYTLSFLPTPGLRPQIIFFTFMCVKVLSHKYKCPQKPEELDPPVAGVPGDGELPSEVLSIKLGSFGRAVRVLNCQATLPAPPFVLFVVVLRQNLMWTRML